MMATVFGTQTVTKSQTQVGISRLDLKLKSDAAFHITIKTNQDHGVVFIWFEFLFIFLSMFSGSRFMTRLRTDFSEEILMSNS